MAKRRKQPKACGIYECKRAAKTKGKCDAHYHRDRKFRKENGLGTGDGIPSDKLAAYEAVMRRPVDRGGVGEGAAERPPQVELLRACMAVAEILRPLHPDDRRDVLYAAREVLS